MNAVSCERVREVLPELVRERLPGTERQAVERHLAGCRECRAEHDVLRLVAQARPPVPAGLEARVLAAQRQPSPVRRWGSPGQLAMAATLAAAVIGGALLIDGGSLSSRNGATAAEDSGTGVLLPAVADPLLQGSLLPELTEAELETLLEEMGS